MKNKLSIRQISELSGVSVATVSRVINQNGRFSKETEERVREVIEEWEYVPNMVARGLRKNASSIVGVIVPDITNEFFAKIVLAIQMRLFEHSYSVIICNTNEQSDLEKNHLAFLRAQNVSGLVFISGNPSHDVSSAAIPTVYIDRRPRNPKLSNPVIVESDNRRGGYLAVRELLDCGCRRIAALVDIRPHAAGRDRYEGFLEGLQEAGLPHDPKLLIAVTEVGYEVALRAVGECWDEGNRFDGIFCGTDWLAMGAVSALTSRNLTIPQEVKVVGFDDVSISAFSQKPITTIRQEADEMGYVTVEILMRLMRGEPLEQRHQVLPVSLVKRATTRE